MKTKSRFLSAVVAAIREQELEMPWKRVSSHSVRVARRLAAKTLTKDPQEDQAAGPDG